METDPPPQQEVESKPAPSTDYVLTPSGKKRWLKATTGDIILSVLFPGWGLGIGVFALCKGEKKRAVTMISIGVCIILLLLLSGRFG